MPTDHNVNAPTTHDKPEMGPDITVTVDTVSKTIHRGSWIVSDLKKEVGVAADRALDEIINGEFKPLQDDHRITIKGGEVFVSHVRQGGSS